MNCKNCGFEIGASDAQFCPNCGEKLEQPKYNKEEKSIFAHDISAVWPEWELEKKIGKGSYGIVYKAVRRDSGIESHAAIKIVSIPTDESELDSLLSELTIENSKKYLKDIVDEFVGEIRLMESLKGTPNIVSVEDYKVIEKTDEIGWDIYIRMELLTPFNDYCKNHALSEEEVLKLGTDICTALEICEKRNIIHRDIKPENIFMNDFGYFKLGDFGIARKLENMSAGLSQKGTYNYMAPEVARGTVYDARVDIYSLGVVLYRLLNNNMLPFITNETQLRSPNARRQAVERRINGEMIPPPCNASPETVNVILRACSPDPNVRFSSPGEMKKALNNAAKQINTDNRNTNVATADIITAHDMSGQYTGDRSGYITGNHSGQYTGNRSGYVPGNHSGQYTGERSGYVSVDLGNSRNDAVDSEGTIRVNYGNVKNENIKNENVSGIISGGSVINDVPPPEVTPHNGGDGVGSNGINGGTVKKENEGTKKRKKGIIIAVAVLSVLLILVGGTVVFILSGNDKPEEDTTAAETTTEEITTEEITTEEESVTHESEETTTQEETTQEAAEVITTSGTTYVPTTTSPRPTQPPTTERPTQPTTERATTGEDVIIAPTIDWSFLE